MRGMSGEMAVAASGPSGAGAVAAGSQATCEAAARILREGGTAIDAVVAGAFAATVAEPTLASLGGGGFCLHAGPARQGQLGRAPRVVDFFVDMPGLDRPTGEPRAMDSLHVTFGSGVQQEFHAGWASVAVPGTLSGLLHLHAEGGRLPLAHVIEPARQAASEGILLEEVQVEFIRVIGPILTLTAASAALFTPPLRGEPFRNPAYARMLEQLADGVPAATAYAAPLADEIGEHGGLVTRADLAAYAVADRAPVGARRGDGWIWTNPPPAFGGAIVLESLGLVPTEQPGRHDGDGVAGPLGLVDALRSATQRHRSHVPEVRRGTTHLSVVDGEGGIAALSLSNGSGSGTVAGGIALNNMLGEADLHPGGFHSLPPGARLSSMMAPILSVTDDGAMHAMGTGGSERIRSALVQVLVRALDEGSTLAEAIAAPRLHVGEDLVDVEPGFAEAYVDTLGQARVWPTPDLYFGGVHAVSRDADGRVTAVADRRRGGAVAIV